MLSVKRLMSKFNSFKNIARLWTAVLVGGAPILRWVARAFRAHTSTRVERSAPNIVKNSVKLVVAGRLGTKDSKTSTRMKPLPRSRKHVHVKSHQRKRSRRLLTVSVVHGANDATDNGTASKTSA